MTGNKKRSASYGAERHCFLGWRLQCLTESRSRPFRVPDLFSFVGTLRLFNYRIAGA